MLMFLIIYNKPISVISYYRFFLKLFSLDISDVVFILVLNFNTSTHLSTFFKIISMLYKEQQEGTTLPRAWWYDVTNSFINFFWMLCANVFDWPCWLFTSKESHVVCSTSI